MILTGKDAYPFSPKLNATESSSIGPEAQSSGIGRFSLTESDAGGSKKRQTCYLLSKRFVFL